MLVKGKKMQLSSFTRWSLAALFFGLLLSCGFLLATERILSIYDIVLLESSIWAPIIKFIAVGVLLWCGYRYTDHLMLLLPKGRLAFLLMAGALFLLYTRQELLVLAAIAIGLAIHLMLLLSYQKRGDSLALYYSGLLIGVAMLFEPIALLLLLEIWCMALLLRFISFKGVVASIMGACTPFWILLPIALFGFLEHTFLGVLLNKFALDNILSVVDIHFLPSHQLPLYLLLLWSLIALSGLLYQDHSRGIHTYLNYRAYLNALLINTLLLVCYADSRVFLGIQLLLLGVSLSKRYEELTDKSRLLFSLAFLGTLTWIMVEMYIR